jgi:uncharacterized protein (UPF0261 family)
MSVFLLATLDTKGREADFARSRLERHGLRVTLVDVGSLGSPAVPPDVSREDFFAAVGVRLQDLERRRDRGEAVHAAAEAAARLAAERFARGEVDGVLGLGGSAGTTIATAAMRALPLGVPKVMLSTLASGNVRGFVGAKDIVMVHSVVDICGLNRICRTVLCEAADALAGMIKGARLTGDVDPAGGRPLVAATMFGVTTPCVDRAREVLEEAGYEVLVFHATGSGGQAMESLIRDGVFHGVLDITTTELADEVVGGFLSAGPNRLAAASDCGVPQVVSVGATDMVNFHDFDSVPVRFRDRNLYRHNANVTLMRTTPEESTAIGRWIARQVSAARPGTAAVLLPMQGVSAIDRAGQPFCDVAARTALFEAIRGGHACAELVEIDCHINDPEFAEAAAGKLLELMEKNKRR